MIAFCNDWGIKFAFYEPADEESLRAAIQAAPTQLV